jgi:hypothetical protein
LLLAFKFFDGLMADNGYNNNISILFNLIWFIFYVNLMNCKSIFVCDCCRSLQRTTAEIQNYSFDGSMGKLLDRDRDTTSQDSGISQMSAGQCDRLDVLEERFEELSISPLKMHNNVSSASDTDNRTEHNVIMLTQGCIRSPVSRSSPTPQRLTSSPLREFNGLDKTPSRDGSFDATDNGFVNRGRPLASLTGFR